MRLIASCATTSKAPHTENAKLGRQRRPPDGETPDSAAHYIASLTAELAKIARRNGLDALSHLLEMARLEADQATKDGTTELP